MTYSSYMTQSHHINILHHIYTHTHSEREREREREIITKKLVNAGVAGEGRRR